MKTLLIFCSFLVLGACIKDKGNNCIDPNLKDANAACYEIYAPVCGCNGKTYSNDCFAKIDGVLEYTDGKCE